MQPWSVSNLHPDAVAVSASRRTDIPRYYARWFEGRLREGFADYVPMGPPRVLRRSLLAHDVTHVCHWTRWPVPFWRTLDLEQDLGFPVLFNVTLTGLGGTPLEPEVPATRPALDALLDLSRRVGPAAVAWRFDPVLISLRHTPERTLERFAVLASELGGRVDRVVTSFHQPYAKSRGRLAAYEAATGDRLVALDAAEQATLALALRDEASRHGLRLTLCCVPETSAATGLPRAECNSWEWATRAWPLLAAHGSLKARPTRKGCACSAEWDVGAYDSCAGGCLYCYANRDFGLSTRHMKVHRPERACLAQNPSGR